MEAGVSFSQEEAEVNVDQPRSMSANTSEIHFNEDVKASDFFISASYALDWPLFSLTPSMGLGYQQSQRDTVIDALIKNILLREKETTDLDSGYFMSGVTLSHLYESTKEILWQPSLSLSWTQSLSGNAKSQTNLELHNMRGRQLKSSQQTGRNTVNSGAYSASLLMLVGDYYAEFSYANTFNTDFKSQSLSMLLGIDF